MKQELKVDTAMIDRLELKYPGAKAKVSKTSKYFKRGAIASILGSDRKIYELIKSLEEKNSQCDYLTYLDEMVVLYRKYVGVADVEKKTLGEVMTPIELVENMLDKFPSEVWSNPKLKWFDPCAGVGTFPSIIVQRLMKGLETFEKNPIKRYRHIIEEMIYVCELQEKNLFVFNCVFDKDDTNETNYYCGSFLDEGFDNHMKNEWNIEKFDIVIANPPYQQFMESGEKSKNTLWSKFIQKGSNILNKNGFISMVTPDGWCSPTADIPEGKISIFNDIFKTMNLKFIATNNFVKPFFKTIGTSFAYFVCENKKYKGKTLFNDGDNTFSFDVSNLNFIPKNLNKLSLSIHEKILIGENKFKFERYQKKDGGMLDNRHPHFNIPKVKFSRGLAKFKVDGDNGNSGYDVFTYAYFLNENETLGSALSVLNSKVFNFVLNQKWNQYFTKYIPNQVNKPKLNKIYTDSDLYKYFNLTQEEINFIESQTK